MDFSKEPKSNKLNFSLDSRYIIAVLLIIIAAMLAMWRPWSVSHSSSDRTISVTGQATIKAEPDEFVFSPTYQFKNNDKNAALAELTKKSEEVTKQLKQLGVAENKIKSASDSHDYNYLPEHRNGQDIYTLRLTITVGNKEMAQKVQDYLLSTNPTGSVSPQPNFSEAKRKELENKARDAATKDARAKADQSAENIGFKIGKVKSVDDAAGFGGILPYARDTAEPAIAEDQKQSLSVQPGENELSYRVTVVYFVR